MFHSVEVPTKTLASFQSVGSDSPQIFAFDCGSLELSFAILSLDQVYRAHYKKSLPHKSELIELIRDTQIY
jgi:hypothetical protein